jgi:hypothetical protein
MSPGQIEKSPVQIRLIGKAAVFTALALSLSLAVGGGPARAASSDFTPEAVFALPDHHDIDDRCQDARKFADHASQTTADIDGNAAFAGAQAFFDCYRLPRLNPDEDAQRYLYLAAATALYLAATKSDHTIAGKMYLKADSMARELGAVGPDHLTQIVAYIGDSQSGSLSALSPGAAANPAKQGTVVRLNPLGYAHAEKFTDVADALLTAIGEQVSAAPASGATALPQAVTTQPK